MLKEQGLTPVLCIGETEAENEAGKTEEVCARQIDAVLKTQGAAAFEGVVIAYEPVWAIGTGKSATPARLRLFTNSFVITLLKLTRKSLNRLLSSTAVP